MPSTRFSIITASMALAACVSSSSGGATSSDGGATDGSTPDGSTEHPDAGTLHDATSPPDGADQDAYAGATVHFSGTIVETSEAPLEGATVCAYGEPSIPCSTTDGSGTFDVLLPANSQTGITLVASGHDSVLVPFVTTTLDESGSELGMAETTTIATDFTALGGTYPATATGFMLVEIDAPGSQAALAGVSVSITPSSGGGPLYLTSAGAPDPTATETSDFSIVYFANIAPGVVTVTASATSGSISCTADFGGWPTPTANSVSVPIAGGFDTHTGLLCTLVPSDSGAPDGGGD